MTTARAPVTLEAARLAKQSMKKRLAGVSGLAGIGLTRRDAGYAVKVNLIEASASHGLPDECDGVPLVVEVVGPVRKLGA